MRSRGPWPAEPAASAGEVERAAEGPLSGGGNPDASVVRLPRSTAGSDGFDRSPGLATPVADSVARDPASEKRIGRARSKRSPSADRHPPCAVTASRVEALLRSGDLSSLRPRIPPALWPLLEGAALLLGKDGPLGSRGPLGPLGPLGTNVWNPSVWMRFAGDWHRLSDGLGQLGGPASELGPLGSFGPIASTAAWFHANALDPLSPQLGAGGAFAVLGPLGPLGALGALGFLGQMGGHGFRPNAAGEFVGGAGVVRSTDVRSEGKRRTHALVELYPEASSKSLKRNDASWMILGTIEKDEEKGPSLGERTTGAAAPERAAGEPDTFSFSSDRARILTLTVVPESIADTFELELLDHRGRVLARSDSEALINWIQLEVEEDRRLAARVRLKKSDPNASIFMHPMPLYVDSVLLPLVAWGRLVTPLLRAWGIDLDRRAAGHAYRLVSVGAGAGALGSGGRIGGDHPSRLPRRTR